MSRSGVPSPEFTSSNRTSSTSAPPFLRNIGAVESLPSETSIARCGRISMSICAEQKDGRVAAPALYRLFGILTASDLDLPLPENQGEAEASVLVHRGTVKEAGELVHRTDIPMPFTCFRQDDAVILVWPDARFAVTSDRVIVDADNDNVAVTLLLHPVWSVVLAARGQEALHGSVIECGGRGVAIQGRSGVGKSTASLGLLDRGWRLVTDDLIAFDEARRVLPGPPFVRLMPDNATSRPGSIDAGGKVRFWPSTCPDAVSLMAMVVLVEGVEHPARLDGVSAVDALLTQVYNPILTHPGQARRRFDLVFELVERVPIYAAPPRSLTTDRLEQLLAETQR